MNRRKIFITIFLLTLNLATWTACSNQEEEEIKTTVSPEEMQQQLVQRGEYLVTVGGCHDCHSPKKMGPHGPEIIPELALSGYPANRPIAEVDMTMLPEGFGVFYPDLTAAIGPWGTSFAANLTPDPTGLGNWSYEQFKKAMTEGKAKGMDGGRMLLPPMPWFNFKHLKDEDLRAMFAYLQSIPPVENLVPAPLPPDRM